MNPSSQPIQRDLDSGSWYDTGMNKVRLLVDRKDTEATEVLLNVFPAGIQTPFHLHPEKERVFYILEGTGTIHVGDQVFKVKPGHIVFVPRNVTHRTDADSQGDLRYLVFNGMCDRTQLDAPSFAEHWEKLLPGRQAAGRQAGYLKAG